jgi:uncharacterized protein (TIGR02996 family)
MEELATCLRNNLRANGRVLISPHLITVLIDDGEFQVVSYIFDGLYLDEYGSRAAFLLHEDWRLPVGSSEGTFEPTEPTSSEIPPGTGDGTLYWTWTSWGGGPNLLNLGPAVRLEGVRVPDLVRYLARHEPCEHWSVYWLILRARLLANGATAEPLEERFLEALLDDPDDELTWAAYSDWLQERNLPSPGVVLLGRALEALVTFPLEGNIFVAWEGVRFGTVRQTRSALDQVAAADQPQQPTSHDPSKSRVHVGEHLAQLCAHVGHRPSRGDVYQQWIFFDDHWAAVHPDLANSILRYDRCWDMLSPGGPQDNQEP